MTDERPWYQTFFERDYYDTYYAHHRTAAGGQDEEGTLRQVAFVVDALQLENGARVLDLACGYGRHSVELARRGYDVTGLDLSAYHIDLARKVADDAGVRVAWINDDMRNMPVSPPFDAVISVFTSFGYLESDDEDARVVGRIAEALRPGGRFFIDTNNAVRTLRAFEKSSVTRQDDGTLLIEERAYDPLVGRFDATWTRVSPEGDWKQHEIHPRAYTPEELRRMIGSAGMRVVAAYGDFEGAPLEMDARRAILVAEK